MRAAPVPRAVSGAFGGSRQLLALPGRLQRPPRPPYPAPLPLPSYALPWHVRDFPRGGAPVCACAFNCFAGRGLQAKKSTVMGAATKTIIPVVSWYCEAPDYVWQIHKLTKTVHRCLGMHPGESITFGRTLLLHGLER